MSAEPLAGLQAHRRSGELVPVDVVTYIRLSTITENLLVDPKPILATQPFRKPRLDRFIAQGREA